MVAYCITMRDEISTRKEDGGLEGMESLLARLRPFGL
jgi:hypothetical protein